MMEIKNNTIEIIDFNQEDYKVNLVDISELKDFSLADISDGNTRWINIDGQCSEQTLNLLSNVFNIHHLVIDDILNNNQQAKIEDYGDYLYIVANMIFYSDNDLIFEHMSFVLGKNYIISLGETKGDVFDIIRERIRIKASQIRRSGADYLIYTLLDSIVNGYFSVLEVLSDKIDLIEEKVMIDPSPEHLHEIRNIRKILLYIRKYVWPLREVTSWMGKDTTELIRDTTELYIRDVYDHIIQVLDSIETYREMLSSLVELNNSNTSFKLNEIMKVLTIISTIFIPLTFIAGVYGMNFKYMPELGFKMGYGITWVIMIMIAIAMVYYFKKKKWF